MATKIIQHYLSSKKSYSMIALEANMSVSSVYWCVKNPWRVSIEMFLAVAKSVGLPDDEARPEWQKIRREYYGKKYAKI